MPTFTALTTLTGRDPAYALGEAMERLIPEPTGVGVFEVELSGCCTISHDKGGGFTGKTERGEMLEKDFVPQRLLWRWQCFDDDGGAAHPRCQTGKGEHRGIGWHHHAGPLKGRRPRLKVPAIDRICGPCLNAHGLGQRAVPKRNTLAEGLHENGFREGRSGQTKGGGGLTRCGNVK